MRAHRLTVALGLAFAALTVSTSAASAADSIYWANGTGNSIGVAALDGTSGGIVDAGGMPFNNPQGIAIDVAHARIYWANADTNKILYVSLFDTPLTGPIESGEVNTTGAHVNHPQGVAIDPVTRRIYWANTNGGQISYANLDGSGGKDVVTHYEGATGVTVDPAAHRVYWANALIDTSDPNNPKGTGSIDYVDEDGGPPHQVDTGTATVSAPQGVALDPARKRVYWANYWNSTISYANLDGSGGGDLETGLATVNHPSGVALDDAGFIHWANSGGDKISYASVDGSGGAGDHETGVASVSGADFPVIFKAPRPLAAPIVKGQARLSCSTGRWTPDLVYAFLYRRPTGFDYQWSRDGKDLAGARNRILAPAAAGRYRCRVGAYNLAGRSTKTSAPRRVYPNTKITRMRLRKTSRRVKFSFAGERRPTGFQCALARGTRRHHGKFRFKRCTSPKAYRHLHPRRYVFAVRATSGVGPDPSPARRSFRG